MNLTSKELSKLTDDFFKTSNTENSSNNELVKNIHYCLNKNRINFSAASVAPFALKHRDWVIIQPSPMLSVLLKALSMAF